MKNTWLYAVRINTIQFRELIRKLWGVFANIQATNGQKMWVNKLWIQMQVIFQRLGLKYQLQRRVPKIDGHHILRTLKVCTLHWRTGYRHHQSQRHGLLQSQLGTAADQRVPLISRMPISLICQASSSSSLVDERLVNPADTAATSLQHLEQLGGEHRPQPTQQLQLFRSPTRRSQRHINPFNGDPGEVL